VKASAFRRWPVLGAYSPVQTTRFTGGHDFTGNEKISLINYKNMKVFQFLVQKYFVGFNIFN
jgi:hypothetical protein